MNAALVAPQHVAFVEGLATGTHIRLFTSVCPEVVLEALLGSIKAGTLWASEGLLFGVLCHLVSSQVLPGCHRFATNLTHQLDIIGTVEALLMGTQVTHAQEG